MNNAATAILKAVWLACSLGLISTCVVNRAGAAAPSIDFEQAVAPLIINHCLECHHPGKASGRLNLATADGALKGGESGPALVAGKPAASLLIQRIADGEMPPQESGKHRPLTAAEIETLRAWIESGAAWPAGRQLGLHEQSVDLDAARAFWSFRPVARPPVPQVKHHDQVANTIDAFIWEKLNAAGLEMASPATRQDLLRRAWLDIVGLPPTIAEQDRFASDDSADAYDRLINRLLANPAYGERWARHWLDLVRYADSNGYERDAGKPSVWRYRDYVIDSLNADKPFDRFVVEQLAGDELPDRNAETVTATGFHVLGAWQDEVDPLEAPQYRADELDDMIRTTAQTFLGLTLGCARCHNHKFDPLSMVDYYSMAAILSPLKRPNKGRADGDRPAGTRAELAAVAARDVQIAAIQGEIEQLRSEAQTAWLESGKSQLPSEAIAAVRLAPKDRKPAHNELVKNHAGALNEEVAAAFSDDQRRQIAEREQSIRHLREKVPDLGRAYFPYEDTPTPAPTHLLLSGRASNPGPEMQPRVPAVLAKSQPAFLAPDVYGTRRRLTLAHWIASPDNPLTARVIVNRVWQHHFGTGLVATPSDFGHIGERPTHPALLDWLADWFVRDANWSLKKLHRLILTSRTYRQSNAADARRREIDPQNKWLARFPFRRLDVEAIRDSMLAVSGKLNPAMHGPAVHLPIPASVIEAHTDKEKAWKVSLEPDIYRRTIYGYVKRTLVVPMLEVLDFCDTINSSERRSVTSIAPQALTLYNGEFVNQQAAFFAQRLIDEAGPEPNRQIERAYRLALCRRPSESETEALRKFLETEAQERQREATAGGKAFSAGEAQGAALIQMCRAILNLNEFVYPN